MHIENERGVPQASPMVTERLRQIDPALHLKAYKLGDNGIQWAVLCDWPETDKRRTRIQVGELPASAAFDIVAWVPLAVSPDEIPAYVEKGLTGFSGSLDHVHAMLHRIHRENAKAPSERWSKVEDKA